MTYTLTDAPRHAGMKTWDCHFCEYEQLAKPTFLLTSEGKVVAAGQRCAAIALGLADETNSMPAIRKVLRNAEAEAAKARAAQRQAAAEAEDARWQAFLDEKAPAQYKGDRIAQISTLGGFLKASAAYDEWKVS